MLLRSLSAASHSSSTPKFAAEPLFCSALDAFFFPTMGLISAEARCRDARGGVFAGRVTPKVTAEKILAEALW
jgi:hypothetical protein